MECRDGMRLLCPLVILLGLEACVGSEPVGIGRCESAETTVKMDFFHRPLPEIPLPNDVATRFDASSPTGLRINASMVAPTHFESRVRRLMDGLDGWGLFQPITIPFTGELDIGSILTGHRDPDYDLSNDVVYLINIDRRSPEFGRLHHLDVGNGNYPLILEKPERYGKNDPREWLLTLLFEEADEDTNGNGVMDPGEDTDADGVLDRPNYLPGRHPDRDDLTGRADALMTFYERETNTLIIRPMLPLNERTTYAVVVTRRIKDARGHRVGSPYPYIHHASQSGALSPLPEVLPPELDMDDVAFAFAFTTQSAVSPMMAVREGLYGQGVQAHLGDDFPAEIASLLPARSPEDFPDMKLPHLAHPEEYIDALELMVVSLLEQEGGTVFLNMAMEAQQYVDFHVMGTYHSPQLFERFDAEGNPLDLHDQIWPPDIDRIPAPARAEEIPFWLIVPRKEVSVRGQGKPAPVVILSHGYTSSRIEILFMGSFLAKQGIASIAIDHPSHGIGASTTEEMLANAFAESLGMRPFMEAVLSGRARDHNGDDRKDSGADFMTAYMFHTRDMVRQSALDYLQLVRILRSFDGQRRWSFDLDNDGQGDMAGDFDGDGHVDISGAEHIGYAGPSLGGIVGTVMVSLEPAIRTFIDISPGGSLNDVGIRSFQMGVAEAIFLRVMGPLYTGTQDPAKGEMVLETVIPDATAIGEIHLGTVSGVVAGDTMVVENLDNEMRGCGLVDSQGRVRAGVESDRGDRTRLLFFSGPVVTGPDCQLRQGVAPKLTVDTFEKEVVFQRRTHPAGQPLEALATGLGKKRGTPSLRRLINLGAVAVDAADPAVFARHLQLQPLTYASTGETTGASVLMTGSIGDMEVPVNTAITVGRAAGLIDFLRPDPRYGKSVNQVLIDTYTVEAVHRLKRHTSAAGEGIHVDVDNLSQGTDLWGEQVPRLDPPLHVGLDRKDRFGGVSAMIFPFTEPSGFHGFDLPGQMTDRARRSCIEACSAPADDPGPCGCEQLSTFDIGQFMFNTLARYMKSRGREMSLDLCHSSYDCPDFADPPGLRDKSSLP